MMQISLNKIFSNTNSVSQKPESGLANNTMGKNSADSVSFSQNKDKIATPQEKPETQAAQSPNGNLDFYLEMQKHIETAKKHPNFATDVKLKTRIKALETMALDLKISIEKANHPPEQKSNIESTTNIENRTQKNELKVPVISPKELYTEKQKQELLEDTLKDMAQDESKNAERNVEIYRMRQATPPRKFKEIGELLNLSENGAQRIYVKTQKKVETRLKNPKAIEELILKKQKRELIPSILQEMAKESPTAARNVEIFKMRQATPQKTFSEIGKPLKLSAKGVSDIYNKMQKIIEAKIKNPTPPKTYWQLELEKRRQELTPSILQEMAQESPTAARNVQIYQMRQEKPPRTYEKIGELLNYNPASIFKIEKKVQNQLEERIKNPKTQAQLTSEKQRQELVPSLLKELAQESPTAARNVQIYQMRQEKPPRKLEDIGKLLGYSIAYTSKMEKKVQKQLEEKLNPTKTQGQLALEKQRQEHILSLLEEIAQESPNTARNVKIYEMRQEKPPKKFEDIGKVLNICSTSARNGYNKILEILNRKIVKKRLEGFKI